jgi:hypothetical protein
MRVAGGWRLVPICGVWEKPCRAYALIQAQQQSLAAGDTLAQVTSALALSSAEVPVLEALSRMSRAEPPPPPIRPGSKRRSNLLLAAAHWHGR